MRKFPRPKVDLGFTFVRNGIAFPTPDAPRHYHRAALEAARERLGVRGVANW